MATGGIGVAVRRGWRRLRSKHVGVQVFAALAAIAIVGGTVAVVAVVVPGSGSSKGGGGTTSASVGATEAVASTRGVTKDAVTVVFPVIDLSAIANATGLSVESEKNDVAVQTFVDDVNSHGGVNGRRIDARIEKFNPYDDADMRAKCKDWTESSQVFAVIDGIGAWTGDNQLCLTQEHQTPLISNWSTVTDWTERGNPYLWWTAPDQGDVLRNLVHWAVAQGYLGKAVKYAVVAGDRASDKLALEKYLRPALRAAGLPDPQVETLSASTADAATVQAQAPVAVERLKQSGVKAVIPLVPLNAFQPYVAAETQQQYYPRLLLSDYESSVSIALGLAEAQYPGALDGQVGPTALTLGNQDHPEGPPAGYPPGGQECFRIWRAHHKEGPDPEAQGPIMSWCQAIRLFVAGATKAGSSLNRRTFVDGLESVTDLDGTLYPKLAYGPHRRSGPSEFRVVRIHQNDRAHNQCPGLQDDGLPHGSCWLIVDDFRPMNVSR